MPERGVHSASRAEIQIPRRVRGALPTTRSSSLEVFWREQTTDLVWRKPADALHVVRQLPKSALLRGAELNITESCLDRHLATANPNRARPLVWKGEPGETRTVTQVFELHREVRVRAPRRRALRPRRRRCRRPRRHLLHGHGPWRGGDRDARRARGSARPTQGDLRRLQRRRAPRSHQRLRECKVLLERRTARGAEAMRRAVEANVADEAVSADALDREGRRLPAHAGRPRTRRDEAEGRDVWWHDLLAEPP